VKAPAHFPPWLRKSRNPAGASALTASVLRAGNLSTVCEEARCPNRAGCWASGTATFLVLGRRCTRQCRFCAVEGGSPGSPDPTEPVRLAAAAAAMRLAHVVVTMVTRDDLPDGGAAHVAACVRAVRESLPDAGIEALVSDFGGDTGALMAVLESGPDVLAHNLETVERLSPVMRPKASYARSLGMLRYAASAGAAVPKSGLMAGLGEEPAELDRSMADLAVAGVRLLTVGQYLSPAPGRAPVARFLEPDEFAAIAERARLLGFAHVTASPFTRSSLGAREAFEAAAGGRRKDTVASS